MLIIQYFERICETVSLILPCFVWRCEDNATRQEKCDSFGSKIGFLEYSVKSKNRSLPAQSFDCWNYTKFNFKLIKIRFIPRKFLLSCSYPFEFCIFNINWLKNLKVQTLFLTFWDCSQNELHMVLYEVVLNNH